MDNALPEAWVAGSAASEGTPGAANHSGTNATTIFFAAGHDERIDVRLIHDGHFPIHGRILTFQRANDGIRHTSDVIDGAAILD